MQQSVQKFANSADNTDQPLCIIVSAPSQCGEIYITLFMDILDDGRIDSLTNIKLAKSGYWIKENKSARTHKYEILDINNFGKSDKKVSRTIVYSELKKENKKIFILKNEIRFDKIIFDNDTPIDLIKEVIFNFLYFVDCFTERSRSYLDTLGYQLRYELLNISYKITRKNGAFNPTDLDHKDILIDTNNISIGLKILSDLAIQKNVFSETTKNINGKLKFILRDDCLIVKVPYNSDFPTIILQYSATGDGQKLLSAFTSPPNPLRRSLLFDNSFSKKKAFKIFSIIANGEKMDDEVISQIVGEKFCYHGFFEKLNAVVEKTQSAEFGLQQESEVPESLRRIIGKHAAGVLNKKPISYLETPEKSSWVLEESTILFIKKHLEKIRIDEAIEELCKIPTVKSFYTSLLVNLEKEIFNSTINAGIIKEDNLDNIKTQIEHVVIISKLELSDASEISTGLKLFMDLGTKERIKRFTMFFGFIEHVDDFSKNIAFKIAKQYESLNSHLDSRKCLNIFGLAEKVATVIYLIILSKLEQTNKINLEDLICHEIIENKVVEKLIMLEEGKHLRSNT